MTRMTVQVGAGQPFEIVVDKAGSRREIIDYVTKTYGYHIVCFIG